MTASVRAAAPAERWDGRDIFRAFEFASRWLDHHRDVINALNVFPVPDGDTGTNMALTIQASVDAARTATSPAHAGNVAARLAYGSLMGARGNSGVILSQIFRGFASAISESETIDGPDLARALEAARDMAYKAVMRPVEGTMLTVIRIAADHAEASARQNASLLTVLGDALFGARQALARTPDMMDILKQAGVVDAGGQGVVDILEALHRYAEGNTVIDDAPADIPVGATMHFLDDIAELHGEDTFGYCTNFMVFGNDMDFDRVRSDLSAMGQSAVIVGDDAILKVHIHTEKPGDVLQYALGLGYLDQIKIDNMALQTEALTAQRQQEHISGMLVPAISVTGDIGIVAVAAGSGLSAALKSMGANLVVQGGQTMNPSTEELLDAVQQLPTDEVIILPNNKNIVMAANQVLALTEKDVRVIPSQSVPQGLAALSRFNLGDTLDQNTNDMTLALANVQSIEITGAVRDVELNGIDVTTGDIIGVLNGNLVAAGQNLADVVHRALMAIADVEAELVTVFLGEDAAETATAELRHTAESIFPDAEIEIIEGNQPHYQYLISVE